MSDLELGFIGHFVSKSNQQEFCLSPKQEQPSKRQRVWVPAIYVHC